MHFSRRDNGVVVRARRNQTNDNFALIPSSQLLGDLPPALVDDHVHWLNLNTKVIEIRPFEQPWDESPEHWRIDCASGQYRMYKGRETLVDIRSPTWAMVSECFKCFNYIDPDDAGWGRSSLDEFKITGLLITTSPTDSVQSVSMQRLSVALPHCGLSFFVNEMEELESRDFKDMVYAEDQCIGSLFGLESLVLRQKARIAGILVPEALIPRRVLVPNGPLKSWPGSHQVWTNIAVVRFGLTLPSGSD